MTDSEPRFEITDDGPSRKRLKAVVPANLVRDEVEQNYKQLRDTIQLPGFRKGKVPRPILEKRFGKEIAAEVQDELVNRTFRDALDENELQLAGRPEFDEIELKMGEPLEFSAAFDVVPTFELPDYKGIEIKAKSVNVADDEIEAELTKLREHHAQFVESDDKAEYAALKLQILHPEGEEAPEGEDASEFAYHYDDRVVKSDADAIDEYVTSKELAGAIEKSDADSPVEITATASDQHPLPGLQGKDLTVRVARLGWRKRELPALDDDFASNLGVDTMDAMRDRIREYFSQSREQEIDREIESELVDRVVSGAEMDLPAGLVASTTDERKYMREMELRRSGAPEEEVAAKLAEETKEFESNARKEIAERFVLDKIADAERIFVTEDEVAERIGQHAQMFGRRPDEMFEDYRNRGMIGQLRDSIAREKVRQFLRKKATIQRADAAAD